MQEDHADQEDQEGHADPEDLGDQEDHVDQGDQEDLVGSRVKKDRKVGQILLIFMLNMEHFLYNMGQYVYCLLPPDCNPFTSVDNTVVQ